MLEKADTKPADVVGKFSAKGMPVAFLSPTATGLDKSILDAVGPIRSLLAELGVHDYDKQGKGPDHRVKVPAEFVGRSRAMPTIASLYRPATKSGDPRIWFSGLTHYCRPGNLLAITAKDGVIYVVNASDLTLLESIQDLRSPLGRLAERFHAKLSDVAAELMGQIELISRMSYVPTVREGDTGVGATLESLLGIKANSSKAPDYKGIEIKASRLDPATARPRNRVNLFSQVPNWKISPIGSAREMLDRYGYIEAGRRQLYCTIASKTSNTQGLILALEDDMESLWVAEDKNANRLNLMHWEIEVLRGRLQEKHRESFWVKASSRTIGAKEHLHYYKVVHTSKPLVSNLQYLLQDGTVTLDLTISAKGAKSVRDHGYLFKIWPQDLGKIFPNPREYEFPRIA